MQDQGLRLRKDLAGTSVRYSLDRFDPAVALGIAVEERASGGDGGSLPVLLPGMKWRPARVWLPPAPSSTSSGRDNSVRWVWVLASLGRGGRSGLRLQGEQALGLFN